jgi:hypothetical protein
MDINEEADLKEIAISEYHRAALSDPEKRRELSVLTRVGERKGYKFPGLWAAHILKAKEEKAQRQTLNQSLNFPPAPAEGDERWSF